MTVSFFVCVSLSVPSVSDFLRISIVLPRLLFFLVREVLFYTPQLLGVIGYR